MINNLKLFFNLNKLSDETENYLINTLLVTVIFIFINPIFAVLYVTYFSINNNFSKSFTLFILVFAFSLFFLNRKFDVNFYIDSTDDVPNYVTYYINLSKLSITDIFDNFIKSPSGNEPLWHIIWWFVNRITNGNIYIFVFLHYFTIFYFFAKISKILIPQYFEVLFFLILFLFPVTLYNVTHIWRQILSFEMVLLGSILYYVKYEKITGTILIILSIFIHVSSIYFLLLFTAFNIFYLIKKDISKNNILFFVTSIIITITLFYNIILLFLGDTFTRLSGYMDDSTKRENLGIKLIIYMFITFYTLYKSHITKFNFFLFANIIIPFFFPFIFPSLNSIYDRYFSLALTLLSIYVFINAVIIRKNIFYIKDKFLFSTIIFFTIVNLSKLYFEYKGGVGVISFIGNRNAFNFFNGIFSFFINSNYEI